ncbi:DAK2 domain-containing protein [Dehalogenimonas alkenigignens]|uniref:DAK2 domain fusion protein YloV n=1 Tax=Dehalogenimonas alkenigignens TaxID=1217799 RepID=A0A0W0GK35_9CHLR|nr:DAK2 domain-containing protein [Dehalogenimonas alkenigignens]KTB48928.1 DAK2 domain fusion protein YloV [Dehalogenimonas alkenigignens]PVV82746.1 DAK2 domain-containing protein [Dehalogenimonas alkenigignens]
MSAHATMSGQEMRDMLAAAAAWLEKSASDIDALNVFPVPDGDCGTNMLLTLRSAVEEAGKVTASDIGAISSAVAKGALMGARGNSGVISSQIWRGVAIVFKDKEAATASDWAAAWEQAVETAYKGLSNPVEGTILTVLKDVAAAARISAEQDNSIVRLVENSMNAACESVARTPSLLPALRDAGVVDAGGQGLYTVLEGMLHFLRGETEQMQFKKSHVIASSVPVSAKAVRLSPTDEEPFGYCTEFLLKGENLELEKIRARLKRKGQSLIVVGDASTIRVHIHAIAPGRVLNYATKLGTVHKVSIRNMDEQHEDFLALQKDRQPMIDIAIVAIVAGDGFADVFASLGAAGIVPGGQTMNPSTKEIYQAVEAAASDKVIILPNNKNIIPAAEQVKHLSGKTLAIIPTETLPQGVAALLAFDYEADFDTNVSRMNDAKSHVRTVEITHAVRDTKINGFVIKKHQAIGLLDGHLAAVDEVSEKVLADLLAKSDLSRVEVMTLYYGASTTEAAARAMADNLAAKYPGRQVEVVSGGQPHYDYIVSLE